jgi:VWFA-related protein
MRLQSPLPILLLFAGTTALAQQSSTTPQSSTPARQVTLPHVTEGVEVVVVSFEVAVTDKNGPVLGLGREDFRVFHDGKEVELSNFAFYGRQTPNWTPQATPQSSKTDTTGETPQLTVCLFVDNTRLTPIKRDKVINAAIEFVRNRLDPADQVLVVKQDDRPIVILQPTTRRDDAVASLESLHRRPDTRVAAGVEHQRAMVEQEETQRTMERVISAAAERPDAGMKKANMERTLSMQEDAFAQQEYTSVIASTRGIRAVATKMSSLPGRKAIIYLSEGLPAVAGLGDEGLARSRTIGDQTRGQKLIDDVITTAAAAGVAISAIDAGGLDAPWTNTELGKSVTDRAMAKIANTQEPLRRMAAETGGTMVVDNSDLTVGFDRIGRGLEGYYLLGYPLPTKGRGRVHSVEVTLARRAGYQLAYRRKFVERAQPSLVEDRVLTALSFELSDNPLGIVASAGAPTTDPSKRVMVPLRVAVPIGELTLLPEGDLLVGQLTLYVATRDAENRQSDLQREDFRVAIPKGDYESAKNSVWPIKTTVRLGPGEYQVSIGVREQLTGQAGYATLDVSPESEQ